MTRRWAAGAGECYHGGMNAIKDRQTALTFILGVLILANLVAINVRLGGVKDRLDELLEDLRDRAGRR